MEICTVKILNRHACGSGGSGFDREVASPSKYSDRDGAAAGKGLNTDGDQMMTTSIRIEGPSRVVKTDDGLQVGGVANRVAKTGGTSESRMSSVTAKARGMSRSRKSSENRMQRP